MARLGSSTETRALQWACPGAVCHLDGFRNEQPDHFHVETRTFPADYLVSLRADLAALVAAALETGHPVRMPDRFG